MFSIIGDSNNNDYKMKVYFEYKFIVFLYAYMRQIDLSIDRARWENEWPRLLDFYKEQVDPKLIVVYLNNATTEQAYQKDSFLRNLKYYFMKLFYKKGSLLWSEINYFINLLERLDKVLNSGFTEYSYDAEKLRWETAVFISDILMTKLKKRDLKMACLVEHFNQHDDNKVHKIETFGKWGGKVGF